MYWPYGVVLYMLGIQAGIKVNYRLKGSQVTVEEQQQQFELGVGGTVRQTLLQDTQTLPHHVLVACNTQSNTFKRHHCWNRGRSGMRDGKTHQSLSISQCIHELPWDNTYQKTAAPSSERPSLLNRQINKSKQTKAGKASFYTSVNTRISVLAPKRYFTHLPFSTKPLFIANKKQNFSNTSVLNCPFTQNCTRTLPRY